MFRRALIQRPIAFNLFPPEAASRFRPLEQVAIMAMPEAAMNEDDRVMFWEYQIRLPWKSLVVKNITEASRMKASPYDHFGFGVFPPNARHHPASDFWRDNVSHRRAPELRPLSLDATIAFLSSAVSDLSQL